jgi:hypothetical protein
MEWYGTARLFAHSTLDMTYLVSHLERCRLDLSRSRKDVNWECRCWGWGWRRLKGGLLTKLGRFVQVEEEDR